MSITVTQAKQLIPIEQINSSQASQLEMMASLKEQCKILQEKLHQAEENIAKLTVGITIA